MGAHAWRARLLVRGRTSTWAQACMPRSATCMAHALSPVHAPPRWQSRGRSLVLYTRTPADVEERQVTLEGDESMIRNVLDTLTCSCMQ